ncbi:MAG: bile acid:sodium symporter family protein [Steroidobacteraceae bacterium]
MNTLFLNTALLPGAIGVIMFGLGLSLTTADFVRVLRYPRAVVTGLLVQTVVLVGLAYAVTQLFALPPPLAVGLMLLAASPGGALANIFSHLAHGDVALNVTLTAVNSALALVWLPLVLRWAINHFLDADQYVPAPTQKLVEVGTIIVVPVLLGMLVRRLAVDLARRAERPVRFISLLLLAAILVVSITGSGRKLAHQFADMGVACLTFNLVSMAIGYYLPRAVGLDARQSISIAFEIGVHNAAIAIYIAFAVLRDPVIGAVPGLYGLIMIATSSLAVAWLRQRRVLAARTAA